MAGFIAQQCRKMKDGDGAMFEQSIEDKAETGFATSLRSQSLDVKATYYRQLIQVAIPMGHENSQFADPIEKNAESTLLNILAKALREQDLVEAEHGLVAILEWQNGTRMGTKIIENATLLRQHLDTAPEDVTGRCRLIILQDLPRNHVEVIGSRLKIHPTTFARHWGDTSFLETLDDMVDPGKNCYRFMIPYPEFTKAVRFLEQPQREPEELYQADFLVRRLIATPKPFGEWDLRGSIAEIEACLSFWARKHVRGGGWDALIIVDPPVGQKVLFVDHTAAPHVTGVIESHSEILIAPDHEVVQMFAQHDTLPDNIEEWWSLEKSRPAKPVFHQLVDIFETEPITPNSDPLRNCGRLLRDLTQRKWAVFLNHAIHCLILTKGEPYYNNGHFNSAISPLWATSWQKWLLARLVKWSRRLATERVTINSIMRNFGVSLHDNRHPHLRPGEEPLDSMMDAAEASRWRWIYGKMGEYKDLYDTTTTSYIHMLQLREAQIANKQARSVGTITVLGALFVPISIVSGIMSMGGEYIPGGERFWIFFAVTLPTLVMVFLCLFTNIVSWVGARFVMARQKIGRKWNNEEATEAPISPKLTFRKRLVG